MSKITLDEFFQRCCCPEETRFAIQKPFVIEGMQYATDGRLVVRRPSPMVAAELSTKPFPPVHELPWDRDRFEAAAVDLPDLGPLKTETCGECVDGLIRGLECWNCDGAGKFERSEVIRLEGPGVTFHIANGLAHLLSDAGITQLWPLKPEHTVSLNTCDKQGNPGQYAMARFELGEAVGMVMPCRSPRISAAEYIIGGTA